MPDLEVPLADADPETTTGTEPPRATLTSTLLRRVLPLVAGGAFGLLVGLGSIARSGGPWPLVWTTLFLLLTLGRLVLVWAYRRAETRGTLGRSGRRWAALFLAGGVASSLMLGLACAACVLTGDAELSLLSFALVTGTAGVLASRNAGPPHISMLQIAVIEAPAALGLMLTGDPWHRLLGVESAIYLVTLCHVVRRTHGRFSQLVQTERENARLLARFRHMAQHDPLTGLANRARFVEQAAMALAGLPAEPGRGLPATPGRSLPATPGRSLPATPGRAGVAVLYLDLDGFKAVNDTLGHGAGDALLRAVADQLRRESGENDLVARLGGDEFAVIRPRASRAEAEALAARLVQVVARTYELGPGSRARIGASIGVALAPQHARTADELLRRADTALYAAKSERKGCHRMFDPAMEADALARRDLEAELRIAVAEGQGLDLHYQPIIDVSTGKVRAREALLRWRHPLRGPVAPAEFIPVAEESGIILALGEWVLRRACADAVGWPDGARVAVNVSPLQLGRDRGFAALVRDALARSGLPARRLEVEITESALLGDDPATLAELRALRAAGVSIALDDFGTGFSSLSRLREFAFDRIKIDGSFVRDAALRPDCAAIVRAVTELGRRLGAATVAEGVETEEQLALVRGEGCGEVQGYLLGRPQPQAEVRAAEPSSAPARSPEPTPVAPIPG